MARDRAPVGGLRMERAGNRRGARRRTPVCLSFASFPSDVSQAPGCAVGGRTAARGLRGGAACQHGGAATAHHGRKGRQEVRRVLRRMKVAKRRMKRRVKGPRRNAMRRTLRRPTLRKRGAFPSSRAQGTLGAEAGTSRPSAAQDSAREPTLLLARFLASHWQTPLLSSPRVHARARTRAHLAGPGRRPIRQRRPLLAVLPVASRASPLCARARRLARPRCARAFPLPATVLAAAEHERGRRAATQAAGRNG
jgi:hypothetical protein